MKISGFTFIRNAVQTEYPVIAFVFEVDALRAEAGAFHGCQHNQQGAAMVTAAIALSRVLEEKDLPGSVWAIHTPAEEIPPPTKSAMVQAGLFDDCDAVLHWHPSSRNAAGDRSTLARMAVKFRFHGTSAHASAAPEQGRSALDAVAGIPHALSR